MSHAGTVPAPPANEPGEGDKAAYASHGAARRALDVLDALGRAHRATSLAEISRTLGVPQPTVARDLAALEMTGFAERHRQSGRYGPGPSAGRLRRAVFDRFPLRETCLPYLSQIAFASGETTTLTVPVGWFGVQIAAVTGTNAVISAPAVGRTRLLSDGAPSRAILAFRPEISLPGLPRQSGRTGDGPALPDLAAALEQIRRTGIAVEPLEPEASAMAVSFPLRLDGWAVGSFSVEGPVASRAYTSRTGPEGGDLMRRCLDAVTGIEATLRASPALANNPFDHLDPEKVRLEPTNW